MATVIRGSDNFDTSDNATQTELDALSTGKVLQIVSSNTDTEVNTTSTSFTDTGLSATITPSSTSSKILVDCNIWVASNRWMSHITLQRNGTDLGLADAASNRARWFLNWMMDNTVQNTHGHQSNVRGQLLDSPSSTSAVTYRIGHKRRPDNEGGDAYSRINCSVPDRDNSSYDLRHTSTITLMEVAG